MSNATVDASQIAKRHLGTGQAMLRRLSEFLAHSLKILKYINGHNINLSQDVIFILILKAAGQVLITGYTRKSAC